MQIKQMLREDDAVSPVIGVILMVAITVILAAVIASFVLGLGPGEAAPTASFDFEQDGDAVTITHANGEKLDPDNIHIRGSNIDISGAADDSWNSVATDDTDAADAVSSVSEIAGGSSVEVAIDNSGDEYEIRVVWETADSSQTLDTHSGN